jgi:aspartate racemase
LTANSGEDGDSTASGNNAIFEGIMLPTRPLNQKTIGILGGCSNVATAEYYRFLNDGVNDRLGGWEIAETLIVGMNFGNVEAFVRQDDWEGLEAYMRGKVDRLVAGGADVILCVSNTLHRPLEKIMVDVSLPMIHIADPTGQAMRDAGMKKVALFGTRPVMQMDYLKDRYRDRFDVETISPTDEEQKDIDQIIFNELVKNILTAESKQRYLAIAERMRREDGVEGLILGCTEIFLLIDQADIPDFPMFNTAKLHADAAVDFALGGNQ